ncbi:SAM-dependent methyltransferase [Aureimonas sp. Leaf454]|uniref:SAM-dependent methyltransferase n=1 Tax=Aureimonas sp. Leaf454 TaxID=1736381 RepID=UPI000AECA1A9|nr:SAM-dependent methyltransferase [Aureimonas sp. Leaf454]
MKAIDADGFEALFSRSIDPWNYRTSRFEAHKRGVLLKACGLGPYGRGLELACAIGTTTQALSPLCRRLLAVDASPTAIEEARAGRYAKPVTFRTARLPEDAPRGPFDLIVVSEIAYYLKPRALDALTDRLLAALAPGGRIVVLHHVTPFADAAILPARAQAQMTARLARRLAPVLSRRLGRFKVAAFERRRR